MTLVSLYRYVIEQSNLFGRFLSYSENGVLWIQYQHFKVSWIRCCQENLLTFNTISNGGQWKNLYIRRNQLEQTQKYCSLKENELFKFQITLHLYALWLVCSLIFSCLHLNLFYQQFRNYRMQWCKANLSAFDIVDHGGLCKCLYIKKY